MAERQKLKYQPDPTFERRVEIELPSGDLADVGLTLRHRTGPEAKAFEDALAGRLWPDILLDLATGWEFAEPYDRAHLEEFIANYPKAAQMIYRAYVKALLVETEKN